MTTQEDLASFVSRRIAVGRVQPGATDYTWYRHLAPQYFGPDLPVAAEIARALVDDAEFRALQLGGFLNTPTGAFVEQAVEMVVPKVLAPEFDLIVASLKLAADLQQGQKWSKALLALSGSVFMGAVLKEISKAA